MTRINQKDPIKHIYTLVFKIESLKLSSEIQLNTFHFQASIKKEAQMSNLHFIETSITKSESPTK